MPTDSATAGTGQLLEGPLGCAFFLAAHQSNLAVQRLARPELSLDIAAKALAVLVPWTGYAAAGRAEALSRAAEVLELTSNAVSDPRSAWWWQSLPPQSQLSLLEAEPPPGRTSEKVDGSWAAYAQRPGRAFFTATRFGTTSGLHAAAANRVGDWEPAYPLVEENIDVASGARVYEVNNATDWHWLVTTFPSEVRTHGSSPPGVVNDLSPDWDRVAQWWDGVHLTFAGLLSALFVPVTTAAGTTTLWTWESERTLWLHRPFVARSQARLITEELRAGDPQHRPLLLSAEPSGAQDRGWLRRSSARASKWRPGQRAGSP